MAAGSLRRGREQLVDRESLLEAAARSEGRDWAAWWRSDLARQRRPRSGGWPGTLSEARRRLIGRVVRELGRGFAATGAELERAVHAVYDTAKESWDDSSDRDDDFTIGP